MRLHFEPDLKHQMDAVAAVRDLFRGQEDFRTELTLSLAPRSNDLFGAQGVYGNRLALDDEALLDNLRRIQARNGIAPDESLISRDFAIEMETGTGKTYVYLRTVFELHKHYGFSKFVIVVPSVAIKEGVHATLRSTAEHFRDQYAQPMRYFVYDSSNLGDLKTFSNSAGLQIMLVTVGAINKSSNVLYQENREDIETEKPIDLIRNVNPVLIVDEPQSVDGGIDGQGKKALEAMEPLCTLRYSATHDPKSLRTQHVVYRLTPIDAYEAGLVKQIEVDSATVEGGSQGAYVKLLEVKLKRGNPAARVEIEILKKGLSSRAAIDLDDGEDLEEKSGSPSYRGFAIGTIRRGSEALVEVRTPQGSRYLAPGESIGDLQPGILEREMIRRTIQEHLEKELRLNPKGIKVLSLFFVPKVASYRAFDAEGEPILDKDGNHAPGELARVFEEEYSRFIADPRYRALFPDGKSFHPFDEVHKGYFAVDRRSSGGRTVELAKDTNGRTKADDEAYRQIMVAKEELLELSSPLRFIFSHSALKEGWDNPNVFQICNLRDMRSERQRRQTIGRGLRLCVNQGGDRVRDPEVNRLTVIANESYEHFARELQAETEEATDIRFGQVDRHAFAALHLDPENPGDALGKESSEKIWEYLRARDWIDVGGKTLPALRQALDNAGFDLPEAFEPFRLAIESRLRKLSARLPIRNAAERRTVSVRKEVLYGLEFEALWNRVRSRTAWQASFDERAFLDACVRALEALPAFQKTRIQWRKADLHMDEAGISAREKPGATSTVLAPTPMPLPDLMSALEAGTHMTRRGLAYVLRESGRLEDFKKNPAQFIARAVSALGGVRRRMLVQGIRYHKLDGKYFGQEIFDKDLTGYLKSLVTSRKSVYDEVLFDSETELAFAEHLENDARVKVYVKLPRRFEIPTPVGGYNPDWAILLENDDSQRVYFVAETKSTLSEGERRGFENDKIRCGHAHFEALRVDESGPRYEVATSLDDVLAYAFPD